MNIRQFSSSRNINALGKKILNQLSIDSLLKYDWSTVEKTERTPNLVRANTSKKNLSQTQSKIVEGELL